MFLPFMKTARLDFAADNTVAYVADMRGALDLLFAEGGIDPRDVNLILASADGGGPALYNLSKSHSLCCAYRAAAQVPHSKTVAFERYTLSPWRLG